MEDPKKDEDEKVNPNEHSVVEEKKPTQQIPTNHKTFLLICVLLATVLAIVIPVAMLNAKSSSAAEDDVDSESLSNEGNEADASEAPSPVVASSREEAILPILENSSFGNINTCDPRALEWLIVVDINGNALDRLYTYLGTVAIGALPAFLGGVMPANRAALACNKFLKDGVL